MGSGCCGFIIILSRSRHTRVYLSDNEPVDDLLCISFEILVPLTANFLEIKRFSNDNLTCVSQQEKNSE